jgi:hypothetical protein
MTSDAQRAANQRNAKKSRGPRTEAGKARSRQIACREKHAARPSAIGPTCSTGAQVAS